MHYDSLCTGFENARGYPSDREIKVINNSSLWNTGTRVTSGQAQPPKRLTGTKCIKTLSPIIANQWDEENDVHFFMINLHKAIWSRLVGKESQSMNLQFGALATALKARLDTFGPKNQQ